MIFDKLLRALALAAFAMLPGACTSFAPVYGGASGTGVESVRFNFAPPDSRLEQVVLDRLKIAFPGTPSSADPVLDVNVSTTTLPGSLSNALSVSKPVNIRVSGSVSIAQGGETLFMANRFSDTAYQADRLTPVDIFTRSGTQESAAAALAESLRTAILAGYRPAPLPAPAPVLPAQTGAMVTARP